MSIQPKFTWGNVSLGSLAAIAVLQIAACNGQNDASAPTSFTPLAGEADGAVVQIQARRCPAPSAKD